MRLNKTILLKLFECFCYNQVKFGINLELDQLEKKQMFIKVYIHKGINHHLR